MAAYLRHQFPFLGIPVSRRRGLDREVPCGLPAPAEPDLVEVGLACWARPAREYQQFAIGYLRRHVGVASPALLDTAERLIVTKSWPGGCSPTAPRTRAAPTSSCARRSAGRCGSTRAPTRRRWRRSSTATATTCPASAAARR